MLSANNVDQNVNNVDQDKVGIARKYYQSSLTEDQDLSDSDDDSEVI